MSGTTRESRLFKPAYDRRIHMRNSKENDAFCIRFGLLSLDVLIAAAVEDGYQLTEVTSRSSTNHQSRLRLSVHPHGKLGDEVSPIREIQVVRPGS